MIIGMYWAADGVADDRILLYRTIEDVPATMLESVQNGINKFLNHHVTVTLGEGALFVTGLVSDHMSNLFDMVVNSENPAQALISRQVLTANGA